MGDAKSQPVDLTLTLRQVREPQIEIVCKACGRSGVHVRKKLVSKHGADLTLARLRRMSAIGCDRIVSSRGDTCAITFPSLERAPSVPK